MFPHRQTDRQAGRQTDRRTDGLTDGRTDRQTETDRAQKRPQNKEQHVGTWLKEGIDTVPTITRFPDVGFATQAEEHTEKIINVSGSFFAEAPNGSKRQERTQLAVPKK